MTDKISCSKDNRKNTHRLNPLLLPITYESANIIKKLKLPRKYTSTHNDETAEVFLSIGHEYNTLLLSSEEVKNVESQVVGKWIKKHNKYQIHLEVLVSTLKNPSPFFRNKVFCEEMAPVLEGIALAETCILTLNPHLLKTKIYIKFKSIDKSYDRIEYWGKLSRWVK